MDAGKCLACGAKLLWHVGKSGKQNPLNAEPDPNGRIFVDGVRYTSHFATCPQAGRFRKPKPMY
jgi:hypothetical protein